jgi:hypothetical protein
MHSETCFIKLNYDLLTDLQRISLPYDSVVRCWNKDAELFHLTQVQPTPPPLQLSRQGTPIYTLLSKPELSYTCLQQESV